MATTEAQERTVSEDERAAAVWSSMVMEPAAKEEDKREQPAEGNRIIRLPDWYIKRIQKRGLRRPNPLPEGFLDDDPEFREMVLAAKEGRNAFIDMEEDILMQVSDKGYAEAMLEIVDGVVKLSIIPKHDSDRTEDVRGS